MASRDKKKGEAKQERNYQIKPLFKDKFRPAEARKLIEEVVNEKLKNETYDEKSVGRLSKEIADECKKKLMTLQKDRYKFLVQTMIGPNMGQGVRVGSRQFWDEDTDDIATFPYMSESMFCLVTAYGIYSY